MICELRGARCDWSAQMSSERRAHGARRPSNSTIVRPNEMGDQGLLFQVVGHAPFWRQTWSRSVLPKWDSKFPSRQLRYYLKRGLPWTCHRKQPCTVHRKRQPKQPRFYGHHSLPHLQPNLLVFSECGNEPPDCWSQTWSGLSRFVQPLSLRTTNLI